MRERRMLTPNLGIFLLACYCCCKFLLAAAPAPAPAFLTFGENFKWDVRDPRYILQSEPVRPAFACGFNWTGTPYHFSIFIIADETVDPQVVWTANRNKPSDDSSVLRLALDGNLELVDGHGSVVWSTGTSGMAVRAMNLEETGNLVLLDADNRKLWQSFDFPTDTLVAGQNLQRGKRLTSFSNSTGASYFVLAKDGDLRAFIDGKPPQMYLQLKDFRKIVRECINHTTSKSTIYEKLLNFTREHCNITTPQFVITAIIHGNTTRTLTKSLNHFMKLESDGRLTVYDWKGGEWNSIEIKDDSDKCLYPLRCGPFGVCRDGECSCPTIPEVETKYFKPLNQQLPDKGCEEVGPIPSCNEPNNRRLADFGNYSYFAYVDPDAAAGDIINLNTCLEACLNNCSCKAVFYNSENENTKGNCYLLDQVFSIRAEPLYREAYISRAFFKVSNQSSPSPAPSLLQDGRKYKYAEYIVGIAAGSLAVAVLVVGIILFLVRRKRVEEEDEEEDELEHVPGMVPKRFSYEELTTATEDFQTILGQGGFGSVFMGILNDGTRIAVKRLDNIGQGMKEFVAEVQTIGSIHHMNLVRLVGFCARKSHRLLVYEYMSNGSLDKWIFHENEKPSLDWRTRLNIIMDTSKGLCYLHEECSQRIVHLDIKPQNILLDENYNAKVSDFGLSKLISRDQSQVVTTMRGTPGYLAPEWLNASISEKADVYSFGVVVMEVICGRRNLDLSQTEGSRHLLRMLYLTQENQQLDLADMTDEERSCYGEEAVRVMRIAMWCLQNDHTRRPPMSLVVKALEGSPELDGLIEFDPFYSMELRSASQTQSGSEKQSDTQSFLLSGPR